MTYTAQTALAAAEQARERWIDGQQRVIAVIDVSGSMPEALTQTWADYLSGIVGVEVLTIDSQVRPYVPDTAVRSSGSSYFPPLIEHIERAAVQPDRVVVFTDGGVFQPVTPQNPALWKWVVVSEYPQDAERSLTGMEVLYAG